jgi:hypothetical protein
MTPNVAIDNRIFCLQRTEGLTPELRKQVFLADIAYLNEKDADASAMLDHIESECERMGITIAQPQMVA